MGDTPEFYDKPDEYWERRGKGMPPLDTGTITAIAELTAKLAAAEAERDRLRGLCVAVHDRLLRGDSDRELMDMLEKGWQNPEDGE